MNEEKLSELGEFGLIRRVTQDLPMRQDIVQGPGDDCAVVHVGEEQLLVSTDLFVEDIHFRRAYASPSDIGWKAATAALSDLAAMGGRPAFSLVSLAAPADTPVSFIEGIYQGLNDACSRHGAAIVGGDTTRLDRIAIDVVVLGRPTGGRFLLRQGAVAGDLLAVTSALGLSAGGLDALAKGRKAPELATHHRRPEARVEAGLLLAAKPAVHALIDITDGLVQDAAHLVEATAGLGVDLEPGGFAVAPVLADYCQRFGIDPTGLILFGGEDYELAFAVAPEDCAQVLEKLHEATGLTGHIVGRFTDLWPGVRIAGAEPRSTGFDHFL